MAKRLLTSSLVALAGFLTWFLVRAIILYGFGHVDPTVNWIPQQAESKFYHGGNLVVGGLVVWTFLYPERSRPILWGTWLGLLLVLLSVALTGR